MSNDDSSAADRGSGFSAGLGAWQPIATAPRDGTPVDLWHRQGFRITEQWWEDEDEVWVPDTRDDADFSHWMPIPCGPSGESA
jgi:hypothetical protein